MDLGILKLNNLETVLKIRSLSQQDDTRSFSGLMEVGMASVKANGANLWSDFNVHDPGITMLEILAYLISELGLRSERPIAELLAAQPNFQADQLSETFPLYEEILSTFSHTAKDWRKFFLSLLKSHPLPGDSPYLLHNVFVKKSNQSIPLFLTPDGQLSFTPTSTPFSINGLYEITPDFVQKGFSENFIISAVPVIGFVTAPEMKFNFPYWDALSPDWAGNTIQTVALIQAPVLLAGDKSEDFYTEVIITFTGVDASQRIPVYVQVLSSFDRQNSVIVNNLKNGISSILMDLSLSGPDVFNPIVTYQNRYNEIRAQLSNLHKAFDEHRSLCEDISRFRTIKIQDIVVSMEIEVRPGVNPVNLLPSLYLMFENLIAPTLVRENFSDYLSSSNSSLEEILQGPFFKSGWITDSQLEDASQKEAIYTSDLIKSVMDFDEVIGVNTFNLSGFIQNVKIAEAEENCLQINDRDIFIPRFNAALSRIIIKRSGQKLYFNNQIIQAQLEALREQTRQTASPEYIAGTLPLIDASPNRPYRSLQYEFPPLYAMGSHQVPRQATEVLKGQNKQFRAFTFFFDQICSNHFQLLNELGETFAVSRTTPFAYAVNSLLEEPSIREVLAEDYEQQLLQLASALNSYLKQRNFILDHLIGRFGEDLMHYELLNLGLYGESALERIVHDKELFLKDYPIFSPKRFNGLNLSEVNDADEPNRWETGKISGFEHSLKRRLGIRNIQRRALAKSSRTIISPNPYNSDLWVSPTFFIIRDAMSNPLWESIQAYDDGRVAINIANQVFQNGISQNSYSVAEDNSDPDNPEWYIQISDEKSIPLVKSIQVFSSEEEALRNIPRQPLALLKQFEGEGLFLLEHTLLRPTSNNNDAVLLHPFAGLTDPYSFLLTLVFPSGFERDFTIPGSASFPIASYNRMRASEFRNYVERVVEEESPAYCMVQFFYLDCDINENPIGGSLNRFETLYHDWLQSDNPREDSIAKQELVDFINTHLYNND